MTTVTDMDSATAPGSSEGSEGNRRSAESRKEGVKVGSPDREGLRKVDQSWVSIAEDKKRLKKYEVAVSMKDGKHSVEIPDEVLDSSTPLWEDFVIGKFLDVAPHIAKIHMVLNKIWKYGDEAAKVEVYEANSMAVRIRVPNPKTREKIIRRGMWNIIGVPMIVSKWTPKIEEEKQEEDTIPMWVHLEKVPLHMFSWEALSFMTSTVGFPVKLHPETRSCTNLEVAKVFVKVDVSTVLPKEITFSKDGSEFTVSFHYPFLPSRCNSCDKWGHTATVCGMKGRGKGKVQSKGNETSGKETELVVSVTGDEVEMQHERSKGMEDQNDEVENKTGGIVITLDTDKELEGNAWSLVSPEKIGRMQMSMEGKSEEIIISASKFSVLNMEEGEEDEIMDVASKDLEGEMVEDSDSSERSESDQLEDNILDQHEKAEMKKGLKRGQRTKAQVAKPVSIRSSRRKN